MCCPLSKFVWGVEHYDANYHYQMELFKALDVMPKLINVRYVLFPIAWFIFFACGKLLALLDLENTVDFLDKGVYLNFYTNLCYFVLVHMSLHFLLAMYEQYLYQNFKIFQVMFQ